MSRKGVTFNDLRLAGEVRTLALNEIKRVLTGKDEEYKKQLILKLAANTLPRINEHSGPDGGALPIPIYGGQSTKNTEHNSNEKDIQS